MYLGGMPRAIIGILLPALLACGPTAPGPEPLKEAGPLAERSPFQGLVGHWMAVNAGDSLHFHEVWRIDDHDQLTGTGCALMGKDTVFLEELAIRKGSDGLIRYIAHIPAQHHGSPVPFTATHVGDSLVFENPAHDHPQRIAYVRAAHGGWLVTVSSDQAGTKRMEQFDLRPAEGRYRHTP